MLLNEAFSNKNLIKQILNPIKSTCFLVLLMSLDIEETCKLFINFLPVISNF